MRAGAAVLAVLALGTAASALEAAPISTPYSVPSQSEPGPTVSLWGVFVRMLVAFLEVLGIELDPASLAGAGPSPAALVSLVAPLLPVLAVAIGLVLVVVAGVVTGRRLPSNAVASIVSGASNGRWLASRTDATESASEPWPPATPTDGVFREWAELTEDVSVTRPHSRTPTEWADAAIDAGHDAERVERITRRFRAVRYGKGDPPSSRRAQRSGTDSDAEAEGDR